MANPRLLNDSVTVYIPIGEDVDGVMQWHVIVFNHVYAEASISLADASKGQRPSDAIKVFIFDANSQAVMDDYEEDTATVCSEIFDVTLEDRSFYDGKSYLVPYDSSSQKQPPLGSRAIKKVLRRKAGQKRMWHWEVEAK